MNCSDQSDSQWSVLAEGCVQKPCSSLNTMAAETEREEWLTYTHTLTPPLILNVLL